MFRLALIYIVFITSLSADEIWDKEIPPSHYLKEFAIKSENDNSKILRHSSYVFIFLGLLMGNNENNTGPEAEYVGDLFLLGGGVGLLIDQIRKLKAFDKPRTPSGKEYIYLDGTTIKALPSANGGDGGTHYDGSTFSAGADISAALEWCGNSDIQDYCFGAHSTAIGGWFNISDISAKEFKAYVSKRVTPGMTGFTSDVYLKCYGDRCAKPMDGGSLSTAGFGATDFKASAGSTYKYSFIDPSGGTPQYYMFDVSDMTLKHCQTWNSSSSICTGDLYPVICATDEGSDKCDNTDWGSTTWLDMTMVKHNVTVNSWTNLDSATRYIWNTSNNVYGDRLVWPTNSSSVISFSPPLNFTYDHTTSNDRNASSTYNGKKFGLEYGGSGNLWGIDWSKEDPTCQMNCDYLPQISIKDGVEVDTTGDSSNDHVLLARRMDLRPSTVSEATCTDKGLSVASSASAPSTPAIETIIDFGTSDEPTGGSLVSTEVCVVDNILSGAAGCPTE